MGRKHGLNVRPVDKDEVGIPVAPRSTGLQVRPGGIAAPAKKKPRSRGLTDKLAAEILAELIGAPDKTAAYTELFGSPEVAIRAFLRDKKAFRAGKSDELYAAIRETKNDEEEA